MGVARRRYQTGTQSEGEEGLTENNFGIYYQYETKKRTPRQRLLSFDNRQ